MAGRAGGLLQTASRLATTFHEAVSGRAEGFQASCPEPFCRRAHLQRKRAARGAAREEAAQALRRLKWWLVSSTTFSTGLSGRPDHV
eukprot:1597569-Alexandrium_andersonii.AAC.1